MANTLTGLIQYVYDSVDVVSRELTGMIPAVYKNAAADQVAKDQNITYDVVPDASLYDIAPASAIPDLDATTVGAGTMAISKVKGVKFHWTGEDEKAVGRQAKTGITNNKFAQAFRALANSIEADLAALYVNASRAYGTAGNTPFAAAGNFTDASFVAKILKDNGAPASDLQLVIDTAAGANLLGIQSQSHMQGSSNPLRYGELLNVFGMSIRESGQIKAHTKGAGTGFDTDLAESLAVGDRTIHVDTGTGTILAGDVVSFTGDSNKYVVSTGNAEIDGTPAEGDFVIQAPGLRATLADGVDMAIGGNYRANMAFSRDAIHLLARLPLMPEGGDAADDVMVVQDPISGLFFQVAMYRAYRSVLFEVAIAWGVKAAKPEHIALLLG
jgi:hypothetical protein